MMTLLTEEALRSLYIYILVPNEFVLTCNNSNLY